MRHDPMQGQLGFDLLLKETDAANSLRACEREAAHLPATMEEAVPFLHALIARHHEAMLAADIDAAMKLRKEAHRVAEKLNGFQPGILADDDAPGCALDRLTAARKGTVPLWGQSGSFRITVKGMRVEIAFDGVFGIGASSTVWLGFSASAVDLEKPFISETGYRSFVGLSGALVAGMTVDAFARLVIEQHIAKALKGKLVAIKPAYRTRRKRRRCA